MAYARGVYSDRGALTKTQFFVANSLGTCEVMIYDTQDYAGLIGTYGGPAFHFDFGSGVGTLVWNQFWENGETPRSWHDERLREVIKLARFQVNEMGAVVGLPITSNTIFRAPVYEFGMMGPALSSDGTRMAFTSTEGNSLVQMRICDVNACAATLEVAFTRIQSPETGQVGGYLAPAIGHNADGQERIYFVYRASAAWSDGDVVAIDNHGSGVWTDPIILVDRDIRYMAAIGDTDTFLSHVSALSEPGVPDKLLISSEATSSTGLRRVDIYDTGSDTLTHFIGRGYRPSWTMHPSIDGAAPNVLVDDSPNSSAQPVLEIDIEGTPQRAVGSASGYGVDSAY